MTATSQGKDGLWAITSYFNPFGYRRRIENYREFRARLAAPLVTVELGYGDEFDLGPMDAEILVQRRGKDVLWQKERLLNEALQSLPDDCREVVWIDCDIIFDGKDWREEARDLLRRFPLIQMYRKVFHLPQNWRDTGLRMREEESQDSVAAALAAGRPASECLAQPLGMGRRPGTYARGFAWAARRDLLDSHGFFDSCIVGGGDTALACAAHGVFEVAMRLHNMNGRQREKYLAWGQPFFESVRGNTAVLDRRIFHLWHGHIADRHSRERHAGLAAFDFDPSRDIALGPGRGWAWSTEKPALHQYVRDYFASRREDGP